MQQLSDDIVRLREPSFYHGNPHTVYAQMREEAPVYWYEAGGFWVLTRYEDIKFVSSSGELFSSESGVLITDVLNKKDILGGMFPDDIEIFVTKDPPRHGELRRILNFAFSRQRIMSMEDRIESIIVEALDQISVDTSFDFVAEVAMPVPIKVIQLFLGLEDASVEDIHQWSDDVFLMGSDLSEDEFTAVVGRIQEMFAYFIRKIDERRKNPKDDYIGHLIESKLDDKSLADMLVATFCQTVMVAGNETTRAAMSAAAHLFAEYPDQYQALRNDPGLINSAMEEILRFRNPTTGFMRMATQDTMIGETAIAKGEYVYMIYGAGNRDPAIFPNPDEFDIRRFPKPTPMHVTFGFGPHVCIGSALARLELRILFKHLLARYSSIEVSGKPERVDSLLGQGYTRLPVTFRAN